MKFIPVQKVNAYESIVEQIETGIQNGTLKPGDRLPSERQLMTDFSVSRTTVREALRVLQVTGMVATKPGDPRGPVITTYSPHVLEKSMTRLASLDTVSRVERLQFRLVLEGNACLLAAEFRTDEELLEIEAARDRLIAVAADENGQFGAGVNDFHASIRKASHNQLIEICGNIVGGVMGEMIDKRLVNEPDRARRLKNSSDNASELVEAIRLQRPLEAATIVKRNIYNYYADDLDPQEAERLQSIMHFHSAEHRELFR